ncbi:MAG TPA: glycoside hydrolase family 3 N-terminal domain-containing protein [Candidatus Dormibacteraeota bacterium]|nr:glycoside hydrolase family 3 N-terminal domain-containing protein [Candidatus Dormibacteraeota bacterium]
MKSSPGRISLLLAVGVLLTACSGGNAGPFPTPSRVSPSQSAAALSLDQEVGAVMMVGFRGMLTDQVLADWKQRQFGGLLIVNLNQNGSTASAISSVIASIRAVTQRRLIASTDQEGGGVCIAVASVPCLPMPVDQAGTTQMASQLHQLGFDVDLGPVSDVCSGSESIMWGRCYGTDPQAVANAVGPVVDGIHAAQMLSASKHFPGHGDTTVSSEVQLPRIDSDLATLQTRNWPPFAAAIAHGTDFVLLGHLFYPAIDPNRSSDLSPATVNFLRTDLNFHGAILSDDMQMGAITSSTSTPQAAVDFLLAGGDMVMVAHDLAVADATYDAIKAAVLSGRLPRARLDEAVATLMSLRTG